MSKILIDDAILENAFSALDYALSKTSDAREKLMFFTPMIDIQKATKEFNSNRFSVLEWHRLTTVEEDGKMFWLDIPEIDCCGKSKQVLVKDRHGVISAVNVDFEENQEDDGEWVSGVYPDGEDWTDYIAWAYLPE